MILFKRPIYRYLFYAAWIVVIGGLVTLLVSANRKAKSRLCQGVMIAINNGGEKIYVEKEAVLKIIERTANGSLVKKHTGEINLASLEKALEKNPWVRDAELFFDTKDVLHVAVAERVPAARVFTIAGNSFYIDSSGFQLPLLENYSSRLPVVTGFTAAKRFNGADSALLHETKEVVRTISENPFWNAQVGQIDITPERNFELIPVVGSHVIRLGSGYGAEEKLAKLMVFYKKVIPKAGLAKYSALDVQFDGQVVAVKRGVISKVDSIQLQKNIEELVKKKAAEQEPDEFLQAAPVQAVMSNGDFDAEPAGKDTVASKPVVPNTAVPVKAPAAKVSVPAKTGRPGTAAAKTTQSSGPAQKPGVEKKQAASKPKAIMPAKTQNEY